MRFFARILAIFLVATFLFTILSPTVFAAGATTTTNSFTLPQTEPGVPNDVHTLTQSIIFGMLSFATCALNGIDLLSPNHECLGYNAATGKLGYTHDAENITSLLTKGIALTFQKPIGTADYVRYVSSNFGFAKQTYAANDGFAQLSPLLKIWVQIRNVSYILFVIIFVGVGFAIMIRAKIDPRTAMTIENQIPKLIIALLLISFSFAIAGLVVDLMWVLVFIAVNLFASIDPTLAKQLQSVTNSVSGNPFDLANSINNVGGFLGISSQAAGGVKDISNTIALAFFQGAIGTVIKFLIILVEPGIIFGCLGNIFNIGGCIDNSLATAVAGFGWLIAFIIFTIAIVIALAKLWWMLIKSYALFIIYVIFGPLMIMGGVLPGSKINFENWLRHLLAYTLVFPTAIGILLLGKVVMDVYSGGTSTVPPLLGMPTSALGPILGFAIIMLLPQSLTIVQDALQAPDMKYLPGIGAMMAAGTTATTTMINKPWQRLTRKENKMEGLDEGPLRKLVLGGAGSWQRRMLGDQGGK